VTSAGHIVTLSPKNAAEMVRPAAGLHRYRAGPQLSRKLYHAFAAQASPQHDGSAVIQPDDAAAVLAQINPENCDLHGYALRIGCPKTLCLRRCGGARHPINYRDLLLGLDFQEMAAKSPIRKLIAAIPPEQRSTTAERLRVAAEFLLKLRARLAET
jgi:hypothetical protein